VTDRNCRGRAGSHILHASLAKDSWMFPTKSPVCTRTVATAACFTAPPVRRTAESGGVGRVVSPCQATVFLIDDDAGLRGSSALLLAASGFAVQEFDRAELLLADAASVCDPHARACLVIDLHLPGLNGFALLEALRRCGSRLPALLISARADSIKALAPRYPNVVFDAVLEKPFAAGRLVEAVAGLLMAASD
jgi:CheY-like chemotaxis protein